MNDTEIMVNSVNSAAAKLRAGMNSGPDGDHPVVLTPAEATVIYRLLTEQFGMKFKR